MAIVLPAPRAASRPTEQAPGRNPELTISGVCGPKSVLGTVTVSAGLLALPELFVDSVPMERSLVGVPVRLVLDQRPPAGESATAPVAVEGTVFAYDARLNLVVLCSPLPGREDLFEVYVVRASHVSEVEVLSEATTKGRPFVPLYLGGGGSSAPQDSLPALDLGKLYELERRSVQRAQERLGKLGRGVSKLAQLVFDALDKTLPCRWDGQNIIVLDSVRVAPPYTVDTIHATDGDQAAAQRVRLVLERELSRLRAGAPESELPVYF